MTRRARLSALLLAVGVVASGCGSSEFEASQQVVVSTPVPTTTLADALPTTIPLTPTPVAVVATATVATEPTEESVGSTAAELVIAEADPEPTVAARLSMNIDKRLEILAELELPAFVPPVDCPAVGELAKFDFQCPTPTSLLAPAGGRVVFKGATEPSMVISQAPRAGAELLWSLPNSEAPMLIIDHGVHGPFGNVMSVLTRLATSHNLPRIGERLDAGSPIGMAVAETGWEIITDNDALGASDFEPPPRSYEEELIIASELAVGAEPVTDADCPLNLGSSGEMPNADRSYRNGIHRGVDFICAARGKSAYALADGTVIAVVSDYEDPTPDNRNALLLNAGLAGFTPTWTLHMLYGNYVMIEHDNTSDGREVVSIYAHLDSVDDEIAAGGPIQAGDRIGEVGNLGTSAAAAGTTDENPRSLHLHWEVLVDGIFLADNRSIAETSEIYRRLLCGENAMKGCPT